MALTDYAKMKTDVILLQETHFLRSSFPKYMSKAYPICYLSNGDTKSKGVAILIHRHVKFQLQRKHIDQEGRYVIVTGLLQNQMVTLASVYAPNTKKTKFFLTFFEKLAEVKEGRLIVGGDFNTILQNNLDRTRDTLAAKHSLELTFDTKRLTKHLRNLALVDIWREKHPLDRDYTYFSPVHGSYSRIDFLFTNSTQFDVVGTAKIHDITWSDHGMVEATGTTVRKTLLDYFRENDPKDTSSANRWDAHKVVVRGVLISIATRAKKEQLKKVSTITEELHRLSIQHKQHPALVTLQRINLLRTDLTRLLADKAAFALTRTKQKYIEYANKPHTMLAPRLSEMVAMHRNPIMPWLDVENVNLTPLAMDQIIWIPEKDRDIPDHLPPT
ncbi:hypothetical protein XELAEV_18012643mg [Xenopus laevis]|uniref:exodeoxyribonuclease III n=1 Tax=Xenopus laevis TaxID=8355 RepID=A0A974DN19_XENLA|nr:hypothetical protein XELAEV_18012643mg [Xenopus laevis]